jgi:transposase
MKDVIAQRDDQAGRWDGSRRFDKRSYRRRNVIERSIGWLKECRRLSTRHEKLAVNYKAMVQLAFFSRILKMRFSDRA